MSIVSLRRYYIIDILNTQTFLISFILELFINENVFCPIQEAIR